MDDLLHQFASMIKSEAQRLGFNACGISKAEFLEQDAIRLKEWLENGFNGDMRYMENNFEKRTDPSKLLPGAQSVISVSLNYYPSKAQADRYAPVLARYAYGKDYHAVIKKRLFLLLAFIENIFQKVNGRVFTDSGPLLEKACAARAGLGWPGKNTTLISKQFGSFFLIGTIIIDKELHYDRPVRDYCGTCKKCLEACPTGALLQPHIIDARRCIAYHTIENRHNNDHIRVLNLSNRVFGCDICQEVCPWNSKAIPHNLEEFEPPAGLLDMTCSEWHNLSEVEFNRLFKKGAPGRTGYITIKRNLEVLKSQLQERKCP